MSLNVIKVSPFSFFSIVILNDTSELSGVLSSVVPVFFNNHKLGFFGDQSPMSGKRSILKDSKEDISSLMLSSLLFCLQQCDLESAESRLSFGLILAQRRKFRDVKFRFGLVEKKRLHLVPYLKIFTGNVRFGRSRIDQYLGRVAVGANYSL